jgi:tRNA (cytidine/uridine-2'-O-)-methyltransferase
MKMTNDPFLNIVLFEPEIPYNTGNIGRLCVGLNCVLHIIEPIGFKMTDKMLKRAGLDYWQKLDCRIYSSLEEFFKTGLSGDFYFASTKAEKPYYEANYKKGDFIFFGKESGGLPDSFHNIHRDKGILIPMPGEIRSLNLCNSAAVILYEAYRQLNSGVINKAK